MAWLISNMLGHGVGVGTLKDWEIIIGLGDILANANKKCIRGCLWGEIWGKDWTWGNFWMEGNVWQSGWTGGCRTGCLSKLITPTADDMGDFTISLSINHSAKLCPLPPLSLSFSLFPPFSLLLGFFVQPGGTEFEGRESPLRWTKAVFFTRRRHGSNPLLPIWPRPLMETRNGETDICWMEKKTRGYFKCTKLSIGFKQWITGALL